MQPILRRENRKLQLLQVRLHVYSIVLRDVTQVAFNEMRLAADHTSRNDLRVVRAILTFRQATLLLQHISLQHISAGRLIVDVSTKAFRDFNYDRTCYVQLDSFRPGTMTVQNFAVRTSQLQIRYFEASWPAATTLHRFEPLHGSMRAYTKKRTHDDDGQQNVDAQNYGHMLSSLMATIQEFLVLSDDEIQRGAEESLKLVNRTAMCPDDNLICIWLQEVWNSEELLRRNEWGR